MSILIIEYSLMRHPLHEFFLFLWGHHMGSSFPEFTRGLARLARESVYVAPGQVVYGC
jgi:hypothetical protein